MSTTFKGYPDIKQFREILKQVRDNFDFKGKDENGDVIYLHDSPYPVLTFTGTVKIHGTNGVFVLFKDFLIINFGLTFIEKFLYDLDIFADDGRT